MLAPDDFFDLAGNSFSGLFEGVTYVWEALNRIRGYIAHVIHPNVKGLNESGPVIPRTMVLHEDRVYDSGFVLEPGKISSGEFIVRKDGAVLQGASVVYAGAVLMDESIQIGKGTVIEPGALIAGPAVLGDCTEVRQGAYIRGSVLVGKSCVVGHATEMKNAVMLGNSQAGHFAYVGDSILGRVNLGAGTKLANLKIVESDVVVRVGEKRYKTDLRKFGAVLGDGVEMGCNSVTSPGTLLSKNVLVYPNCTVSGFHPPGKIIKTRQRPVIRRKK